HQNAPSKNAGQCSGWASGQKFAAWLLVKNSPTVACAQCRSYNVPATAEPFLNGSSSQYVEDMYNAWLRDPSSVHSSWDSFFRNSAQGGAGYQSPPSLAPLGKNEVSIRTLFPGTGSALAGGQIDEKVIDDHLAVQAIIRSYQDIQARGHLVAKLDPLGIMYHDRTTTISETVGSPPDVITRQHKLDYMVLASIQNAASAPRCSFMCVIMGERL
ncbi:hypothetical protein NQ318_001399, partial [Aromia moschata]